MSAAFLANARRASLRTSVLLIVGLVACRDDVANRAEVTAPETVLRRAAAAYNSVPSTLQVILALPAGCEQPPPSNLPDASRGCTTAGLNPFMGLSLVGGRAINWSGTAVDPDPREMRAYNYLTASGHASRGGSPLPESPGAFGSIALGINDRGDVVGSQMFRHCDPNSGLCNEYTPRATLWPAGGGVVDLGSAEVGRGSEAYAINNSGAIVGRASIGGESVPARFSKGTVTPLDASGCRGVAVAINNSGDAVGASCDAAAIWSGSQRTLLPSAAGAIASIARGINDAGDVVGAVTLDSPGFGTPSYNSFYSYVDGALLARASRVYWNRRYPQYGVPALWRGGALTVLSFAPGAVPLGAVAEDINEYGQVIGYAVTDGRFAKVQWQVPNPYPAVTLTAGNTTITAGQSVSLSLRFTDPTPNAAAWSIRVDWGDGTAPYAGSSSAQLIAFPLTRAHQYTRRGTFTATYTVTSKTGYTNSATIPITVN